MLAVTAACDTPGTCLGSLRTTVNRRRGITKKTGRRTLGDMLHVVRLVAIAGYVLVHPDPRSKRRLEDVHLCAGCHAERDGVRGATEPSSGGEVTYRQHCTAGRRQGRRTSDIDHPSSKRRDAVPNVSARRRRQFLPPRRSAVHRSADTPREREEAARRSAPC